MAKNSGEVQRKGGLKLRMSVRELELPENAGKKNAFLKAWKLIKDLPPDNPNSYWAIAGFHGEPFREPYLNTSKGWGGYCNHANVLFPTWHRFQLLRLEHALQTVCPDDDVTMAYWDPTSEKSLNKGIPDLLTDPKVTIDGKEVDNPLRSFKFPLPISGKNADEYYYKPEGYETVRYPHSGIKSPAAAKKVAIKHNEELRKMFARENKTATELLNENIKQWLNGPEPKTSQNNHYDRGIQYKFKACLETESYNEFSNTSSAGASRAPTVSLEAPHNDLHLAIGGFDIPEKKMEAGILHGANGDMGENETAAFDPIFFFLHCNIDRVFWIWQKKYGKTEKFEIDANDKDGAIAQDPPDGPVVGQTPNEMLTMDTILYPFQHANGVPVTSKDAINIHNLGYDYSIGSLDQEEWPENKKFDISVVRLNSEADLQYGHDSPMKLVYSFNDPSKFEGHPSKKDDFFVKIRHINRNEYRGSKLLRLYYKEVKIENYIGQASILSRWNEKVCKNCQNHRMFSAWFNFYGTPIIFTWPPKAEDFVATIVWFDPLDGKYIESPVAVDDVKHGDHVKQGGHWGVPSDYVKQGDDVKQSGPTVSYYLARGSRGRPYYHFWQ